MFAEEEATDCFKVLDWTLTPKECVFCDESCVWSECLCTLAGCVGSFCVFVMEMDPPVEFLGATGPYAEGP